MAPKRAARKAAPPAPPPPPPAESSDETRSGSRSRSDDSEDEEAIAESPVPASTPALKNTPAPAQKGDESESSDDDDEEEEEPVRAAPKNQPPPPQRKEDSDTSGDEEDDEEEQQEEPTRAAPPSAPKKQPPQPQKKGDSDTSGGEGESEEEEEEEAASPPKPAPKKEAEALKPPAVAGTKKPGAAQRIWSTDDEVRILEAIAAYQKRHGTFPQPDALVDVLAGKLDNPAYGSKELQSKVKSLRHRFHTLSGRGELPSKEHDLRLLHLSKLVWTGDKITIPGAASANNGHEPKGFEEMCELYPYLAEEVKGLEATHPGMCKRDFGKMDEDKAHAMDEKIKKQRVAQIKLEMRRADLAKEVTKALVDLVDG